jgi:hypothetical protein
MPTKKDFYGRSAFEQHFEDCSSGIAVFPNLGGDALLIAPCRLEKYKSLDTFAHIANFMRFVQGSML